MQTDTAYVSSGIDFFFTEHTFHVGLEQNWKTVYMAK